MLWYRLLAGPGGSPGAGVGYERAKPVRFSRCQFFVYAGPENASASLPVIPRFTGAVPVHYAGVSRAAAGISSAHAGNLFAAIVRFRIRVPGGFRTFDDTRGRGYLPAD